MADQKTEQQTASTSAASQRTDLQQQGGLPSESVPQSQPQQSSSDPLEGLLYQGSQQQGQSYPEEDLSSESILERVFVDSFMSSVPGQGRSLDSWSHFDGEMPSSVPSDTDHSLNPQMAGGSQGAITLPTSLWPGNTLAGAKLVADGMQQKAIVPANREQGFAVTGAPREVCPPGMASFPLNVDFLHMPIVPLNPAFLAGRAQQILDVDGYDVGSFSTQPSSQPSPDCVGFPPSQLGSKEDRSHALHPSSRIKQEDNLFHLHPTCRPVPQQPRSPGPLYKNEPGSGYESYETQGGRPSSTLQHASFVYPRGSVASTSPAPEARYQTFSLTSHQQLSYPAGGLQELGQIFAPYAKYARLDTESEHSPQYNFEVKPQKICLICSDEASGCHYGVLTCGSCKVFFKRAMEGQQNYLCAGRNDCIIDKIRRKNCPACRLRKCCQAGMVLGGRKFKKFSKVKTVRGMDAGSYAQPLVIPIENQQAVVQRMSTNSTQELQFTPQLLNILQSIEPEVVYAGYDNTKSETPSALLTSMNQLCERQLLCVVKWSKSLPGFRNMHIEDQITLLQYSWMSLMVFAMGWRSYKHVSGQMLYFAPDLILNEQRMKESSIYSLCLSMWQIPQEFVKLSVTQEEFLCMKALLLLNTIPLEGMRSQCVFDEMRGNYIRELVKAIGLRQKGAVASSQRFFQLTKLMDSMHDIVKKLHLFCLNTFLQSRALSVEFPEMMSEVIAAQLPKILAGMVKPLVFHKK